MLQDLANVGELVGGVGVVVTLIYLTLQLRQNTESVRVAAGSSSQLAFQQAYMNIATAPNMAEAVKSHLVVEAQDAASVEYLQYEWWLLSFLMALQMQHNLVEKGLGDPEILNTGRFLIQRGAVFAPAVTTTWAMFRDAFNPRFQAWFDEMMSAENDQMKTFMEQRDAISGAKQA